MSTYLNQYSPGIYGYTRVLLNDLNLIEIIGVGASFCISLRFHLDDAYDMSLSVCENGE